jgi:hypothetical protein
LYGFARDADNAVDLSREYVYRKTMMNHWKGTALILTGILIGCSARAAHHAVAQEAPNPAAPRWQQFCETYDSAEEASQRLAVTGAHGWELVTMSTNGPSLMGCSKRPAP